jgi:gas vesicle protein
MTRMALKHTNHTLGFLTGVVTGSAIAAGLALYFRPRLREQMTESLGDLRDTAAARAQTLANDVADVVDRVADAADEVTARAQEVRNDVASVVARGAHAVVQSAREVERFAKASKTDHVEKHA